MYSSTSLYVTPDLGTGSRDKRWCELWVQEEMLADTHHKRKKRLKVKSNRGRHTTSTFGF